MRTSAAEAFRGAFQLQDPGILIVPSTEESMNCQSYWKFNLDDSMIVKVNMYSMENIDENLRETTRSSTDSLVI